MRFLLFDKANAIPPASVLTAQEVPIIKAKSTTKYFPRSYFPSGKLDRPEGFAIMGCTKGKAGLTNS